MGAEGSKYGSRRLDVGAESRDWVAVHETYKSRISEQQQKDEHARAVSH
jgi:hypothetical protein